MSLIERAVTRLGGNPPVFPADAEATADKPVSVAPVERAVASTIERAVGALGALPEESLADQTRSDVAPASRATSVQPGAVNIRLDALRRRGFVVPDAQTSQTAEEFRVIKRPLIANAFGGGAAPVTHGKRVMVTSAFPGEGKSFCAINLALSIAAERDHKVLLVDADVARPSIPRELGFEAGQGLMDCLLEPDQYDVGKLILQTDVEKLAILPSGRRHAHATELLASQAMRTFLELLSARFPDRLIIFDSPPLLVTTESRVLATHMGQIVLVVEAGKTPKPAVAEALGTLDGACEVVGLVLNKSRGASSGGYGSYGYGYGYGHGRAKPAVG